MPNWCENNLKLSGLKKETVSTITKNMLEDQNPYPEFLNVLHPVPDLQEIMSDEVIQLSAKKENKTVEDYIHSWGFNWQRQNWKVKWDIFIPNHEEYGNPLLDYGDNHVEVKFLSPWAPPVGTYEHLHQEGVEVKAHYCEFGLDYCGFWFDGEDCEYRISDREYPPVFDEKFGITERTGDWNEDDIPSTGENND